MGKKGLAAAADAAAARKAAGKAAAAANKKVNAVKVSKSPGNRRGGPRPGQTWREMVRDVMAGAADPVPASAITSGVARLRGIDRDVGDGYRYVERCVGVMLSRFQERAIDSECRLTVIGAARRGRLYALVPLRPGEEPYPPRWGRGPAART